MATGLGLTLSRRFYTEIVAPTLARQFPALPFAAARIGLGSEVLGYDTEMSADHDYGPCVQIFLREDAFPTLAREIMDALDAAMPETFGGFPVRYPTYTRPQGADVPQMLGSSHGAELYTVASWRDRFLGPGFAGTMSTLDWLSYPEQLFLTVTAGALYRDDMGELSALRSALAYLPRDVWLYKLAAQWNRIAEERAYIGRAGSVGDELGSRVIGARMVHNFMRLAFLIERRYAPYTKWFGAAFAALPSASELSPIFTKVLDAADWRLREEKAMEAVRVLAKLQQARDVPGARPAEEATLHKRPFRFIDTMKLSDGVMAEVADDQLRSLPRFGGADQFLGSFVVPVPAWSEAASSALFAVARKRAATAE